MRMRPALRCGGGNERSAGRGRKRSEGEMKEAGRYNMTTETGAGAPVSCSVGYPP